VLKKSFLHIPGIGIKSEQQLWNSGVVNWEDIATKNPYKLSPKKINTLNNYTKESIKQLQKNNPIYFTDLLPSNGHWRLFSVFRNSTAYIDIETTGIEMWSFEITTIALYDGKSIKYYINGYNLDDFINDIVKYNVIITYNGKIFDVPFIENHLNTKLNHAHIDLRYVLKSLGYSGGLKKCEKSLGIDRGDMDGIDGYFAILLWQDYKKNKNKKALGTLLAYNIEDVVNLETIMIIAYNMKIKKTPFYNSLQLSQPKQPKIPFVPDLKTIARIKHENPDILY
jgi:uncharacterized protein YprB with RNaseH-like and TPR domain